MGLGRGAIREAADGPVHLLTLNEKCLVLNGPVHELWTFPSNLNPGEAQTALGECFVCMNMHGITLDTMDLGWGWGRKAVSFLSSFSPNRRKQKGKERRGISKAERGRRTCYLQAWTRNLYIFK